MPYHKKIPYVRCGSCGFRTENSEYDVLKIVAGDYCPRCGTQLTEHNELTRQSRALAGATDRESDTWSPPSGKELAVKAVAFTIPLGMVYGVFRLMAATAGDKTITINGETAPLFDPAMGNAVIAVVGFAALVVFAIQYAPGYVKHRGWA